MLPNLSITIAFCAAIIAITFVQFYSDDQPSTFSSSTNKVDFGLVEPGTETIKKVELFNPLSQTVRVVIRSSCDCVDVRPEKFNMAPGTKAEFVIELRRRNGERHEDLISTLSTDMLVIGSVRENESEPARDTQIPISIEASFFEPYVVDASAAQIYCDIDSAPTGSVSFSAAGSQVGKPQIAGTAGCVKSASVTWNPEFSAGEIVVQCESGLPPGHYEGTVFLRPPIADGAESSVKANVSALRSGRKFHVPIQFTVAKPFILDTQLVVFRGPVVATKSIHLIETIDGVPCRISEVKRCPPWLNASIDDDGKSLVLTSQLAPSGISTPLEIKVSVARGEYVVSETIGCIQNGVD